MTKTLISLIVFVGFSINFSYAHPRIDLVARICTKVLVQNATNYFQSYADMADEMADEMFRNKFAFEDMGEPPNRLHVLAQCMDDLGEDECALCFNQISTLIPGCFPNTGGRVYFDGCFIRAENYSFYTEATGPEDTKICSTDVNTRKEFSVAVNKVLDMIEVSAPTARGFAMMHGSSRGIEAYGMGSCWKTLDQDLCSTCLSEAAKSALSCLPSIEGRVLNAGCFLRYAQFSFVNNHKHEQGVYSTVTYIGLAFCICMLAIGIGVCFGKMIYKRRSRRKLLKVVGEDLVLKEKLKLLQFKYATLETATENFNEARRLGRGGFGEVYKGRTVLQRSVMK